MVVLKKYGSYCEINEGVLEDIRDCLKMSWIHTHQLVVSFSVYRD